MTRRTLARSRTLAAGARAALALAALVGMVIAGAACSSGGSGKNLRDVCIVVGGDHPVFHEIEENVIAGLGEGGITKENGYRIPPVRRASDPILLQQIVSGFVERKPAPAMIIAIGTAPAQVAVAATKGKGIPVVFGAVTDPVYAGVADSWERPGGNKTGTSDRWPYRLQVQLIKDLVPDARVVGMIYHSGELNTESSLEALRPLLREFGFQAKEKSIESTAEIPQVAEALVHEGVDVFFPPADNMILEGAPALVHVADKHGVPFIAGDEGTVRAGAVGAWATDYSIVGQRTGELAARILRERIPAGKVGEIPVVTIDEGRLVLNLDAARKQGVNIPPALLEKAAVVYGKETEPEAAPAGEAARR